MNGRTPIKQKISTTIHALLWPAVSFAAGGLMAMLLLTTLDLFGIALDTESTLGRLAMTLTATITATLSIYAITIALKKRSAIDIKTNLGISKFNAKYIAIALILGIALVVVGHLILLTLNSLGAFSDDSRNAESFASITLTDLIINILIAAVLTAWFEELLFRGFMLETLQTAYKPIVAAAIVSIAFAIIHFDLFFMPLLFLFSMSLCWLKYKSKSTIPAIIAHALYNSILICASFMGIDL